MNKIIFLFCLFIYFIYYNFLGQQELAMATLSHLEEYANDGLRTLCLAYRVLDSDMFDEWYY